MEIKKAPRKNLESKRSIFLQIGFIITLSLVLIAFEWSSPDLRIGYAPLTEDTDIAIDIVPVTVHKKEVIPPKPSVVDVLVITDDPTIEDPDLYIPDPSDDYPDLNNFVIPVEEPRDEIFIHVEEMPEFPGGESALFRYLATAVKYPEIARINNVQGKVYVNFVINKFGEITSVNIIRGVDPSLDREALRVVSSMPAWEPGKQNNKPVSVSFTVPINFVLR